MKSIFSKLLISIVFVIMFFGCDKYPSNPLENKNPEESISVTHLSTDYLDIEHHIEGLLASKASFVSFKLQVHNLETMALEVQGNVMIGGPPYQHEYGFTFRTDSVFIHLGNCQIEQKLISSIKDGTSYTFNRAILPPNEFSPYEGNQGKVDSITLKNIWCIQADGTRKKVEFIF